MADGVEITRGFTWVTFKPPGVDAHGNYVFEIKGAYPYTDYTDKGNVIDAGAGEDWVSAGWSNDTVHGGDDNDEIQGLAGNDALFGDAGNDNIIGDGTVEDGYLTTVHSVDHGNDILSGDANTDSTRTAPHAHILLLRRRAAARGRRYA